MRLLMLLRLWRRVAIAATLAMTGGAAAAGEVRVAVAANFAGPMAQIGQAFTAATGHTLQLSAGATGTLYAQIIAGAAPFELLLAADDETPRQLVAQGRAVAGTAFTYAVGQLVLWSRAPMRVDEHGAVLAHGEFRQLALANPRLSPYGAAALQVLKARQLEATLAGRLVTADSVAQAHQFVASGRAELGFVALSQVVVPGQPVMGSFWRVPHTLHDQIRQDAVLLKDGEQNEAARALLAYLKTGPARAIITAWGYR